MAGEKKVKQTETDLAGHRRHKKILKPPLAELDFTFSSWIDMRLPDMLWAVLLHYGVGRDAALQAFRRVAEFVHDNPECCDVTLSGIGTFDPDKRRQFIAHLVASAEQARQSLRPLLLFVALPGFQEWQAELGQTETVDGGTLA